MSSNRTTQHQTESTDAQPQTSTTDTEGPSNPLEPSDPEPTEDQQPSGVEAFDITAQTQMQFGDGGDLQPVEDTVGVTLEAFDVDVDKCKKETRLDRPEASGLMADDRPEVESQDDGEQANLFADAEEDQQTLGGRSAQNQCLFDSAEKAQ